MPGLSGPAFSGLSLKVLHEPQRSPFQSSNCRLFWSHCAAAGPHRHFGGNWRWAPCFGSGCVNIPPENDADTAEQAVLDFGEISSASRPASLPASLPINNDSKSTMHCMVCKRSVSNGSSVFLIPSRGTLPSTLSLLLVV